MSRRLIDADDFIEDIKTEAMNLYMDGMKGTPRPHRELLDIIDRIEEQPTIDAVELPCKIGDTVWVARRYKCHKRPRWGIVSEMFFTEDMELCIVVKSVVRGKWGVDIFATYEEAEAQIERNNRKD